MRRNTEPEAFALGKVHWQLFVTLTFVNPPTTHSESVGRVFAWLRKVARQCHVHFRRLLWVLRFEIGLTSGHGHYHLCIAGIPRASLCSRVCRGLEAAWWRTCGGLSEVALYDPARDGVGYILKLPPSPRGLPLECASSSGLGGNDCEPMLSKSLFPALRRGRM